MKSRAKAHEPGPRPAARSPFDVVVVGSSAGGLHALAEFLKPLRADFPAAIVVVQHLSPDHESILAEIMARSSALPVKQAEHNERILPGEVYIGPPDRHLLVGPRRLRLTQSAHVHFSRPSIDLLFESAAAAYGPRCLAVILSGSGRDGSAGIRAIKEAGGAVLAQDPEGADFRHMPEAAIATSCVDRVVPLPELGSTVQNLCLGLAV